MVNASRKIKFSVAQTKVSIIINIVERERKAYYKLLFKIVKDGWHYNEEYGNAI
jgi:hypothetical protein